MRRLVDAGLTAYDVGDVGDVAGEVWRPDTVSSTARNLDAVVRVAAAVADAVAEQAGLGRAPLVLGGDCTIILGVVAGLQRVDPEVRLVYVDGDADLGSPEATRSGALDATGIAHLLGIADNALSRPGTHFPMLGEGTPTMLGYDPTDPDACDER